VIIEKKLMSKAGILALDGDSTLLSKITLPRKGQSINILAIGSEFTIIAL